MSLALAHPGMSTLLEVATLDQLQLFHSDPADLVWKVATDLGRGYVQEIALSEGLLLVILDLEFTADRLQQTSLHPKSLEFEFHLAGSIAGESVILLHLGNEQSWQTQSGQRWLAIEVFITPPRLATYFHCLHANLPPRAQQICDQFFEQLYHDTFGEWAPNPQWAISQVLSDRKLPELAIFNSLETVFPPEVLDEFSQSLCSQTTPAMQGLLAEILACPDRGTLRQLYLESRVLELIRLRLEQIAVPNLVSVPEHPQFPAPNLLSAADTVRICQAKEALLLNWNKPPSLLELSRQVGLNDCTLKRGFRQVFGMTAFDCLYHYRMEQAQQLLVTEEMSVGEVARSIGYASRSSFSKAFRRKFGVSPREYNLKASRGN